MNYILSVINFPKSLLGHLPQRNTATVLCDVKIVFDQGEVWIHRTVLQIWRVWWSSLLQDSSTNVVLLPGVSKVEVEQFLWNVYGEKKISPDDDKKSFHGFTDEEIALSEKLNPFGKCLDQYICCYLYVLQFQFPPIYYHHSTTLISRMTPMI